MRLIDADALKKAVNGRSTHWLNDWSTLGVLAVIDEQPTIDAVRMRHGEWMHGKEIAREYCGDALVSILYENWWCSRCGRKLDTQYTPLYNYCPNCGAKMDGKENANDGKDS